MNTTIIAYSSPRSALFLHYVSQKKHAYIHQLGRELSSVTATSLILAYCRHLSISLEGEGVSLKLGQKFKVAINKFPARLSYFVECCFGPQQYLCLSVRYTVTTDDGLKWKQRVFLVGWYMVTMRIGKHVGFFEIPAFFQICLHLILLKCAVSSTSTFIITCCNNHSQGTGIKKL